MCNYDCDKYNLLKVYICKFGRHIAYLVFPHLISLFFNYMSHLFFFVTLSKIFFCVKIFLINYHSWGSFLFRVSKGGKHGNFIIINLKLEELLISDEELWTYLLEIQLVKFLYIYIYIYILILTKISPHKVTKITDIDIYIRRKDANWNWFKISVCYFIW